MNRPPTGYYYIVNSATDSSYGVNLAVTYKGENVSLNVGNFKSAPAQEWYIADYGDNTGMQSISPTNDTTLQVCFGGSNPQGLTTLPAGGYVWNISRANSDDTYTIQDGEGTVFWGLRQAALAEPVWVANSTSILNQYWQLIASQ